MDEEVGNDEEILRDVRGEGCNFCSPDDTAQASVTEEIRRPPEIEDGRSLIITATRSRFPTERDAGLRDDLIWSKTAVMR